MAYATQADLVQRFGEEELIQLTDRVNVPPTTIDTDIVDEALTDADGEIDGYIGAKYTLPLASVPAILTAYACDIARYRLYEDAVTELIQKRYDRAIAFLRDVAKGVVSLGVDPPATTTGGPQHSAPDRIWDMDTLEGL